MILIGNGPVPFAVTGPPSANGRSDGFAGAGRHSASPVETLPAATRAGTGQPPPAVTAQSGSRAVQPVLAAAKTAKVLTDPEEIPHGHAVRAGTPGAEVDVPPAFLRSPAPPLMQFASIPTELTREIERLRSEIRDMQGRLSEMSESLDALANGAAKDTPATPVPGGSMGAHETPARLSASPEGDIAARIADLRRILSPTEPGVDRHG